jgi:hypothetical protein
MDYNERGYEIRQAYFDADGMPVNSGGGYASWTADHDAMGNTLRYQEFAACGNPIGE